MTYVYTLLLLLIYFNGILFNLLPQLSVLSVWDEIFTIILACLCFLKLYKKNGGRLIINDYSKFLAPWIIVVFIGLIGNVRWHYAGTIEAIFRDIIGFLKFPICLYSFRYLKLDKKFCRAVRGSFLKVIHLLIYIMVICAVLSLFTDIGMSQSEEVRNGINSFQFLFNHPNSFGLIIVMLLSILDSVDDYKSQKGYIIFCLLLLVLTMRTKILAFCAVYFFTKFCANWARKYKLLFILSSVILILWVAYSKLVLVMSWTESARMRFWTESFSILKNCFPVGSGFGTFASHVSGKYGSVLYSMLKINEIFDQHGNPTAILGDTGYPYYIAQFGFWGLILIVISIRRLLIIVGKDFNKSRSAIMLLTYLAIALTGESTLLNVGFEMAITLSILLDLNYEKYSIEEG